jgi:hypothetical protein
VLKYIHEGWNSKESKTNKTKAKTELLDATVLAFPTRENAIAPREQGEKIIGGIKPCNSSDEP